MHSFRSTKEMPLIGFGIGTNLALCTHMESGNQPLLRQFPGQILTTDYN